MESFIRAIPVGRVRLQSAVILREWIRQMIFVVKVGSLSEVKSGAVLCIAIAVIAFAAPAQAQAVYKCTTASGTTYQQMPCANGQEAKPVLIDSGKKASSALTSFLREACIDHKNLPNIQWDNKYKGREIKGTGPIHDLKYDQRRDVSVMTIRFSETSGEVSGGLSKPFGIDCSFDRCIFRYLVTITRPGKELALQHKKGEEFSFAAHLAAIRSNFWISDNKYWMRDYEITTE